MSVRDFRDAAELTRPGDLLEEVKGVRDVRLDLPPLAVVEVALPDHQKAELLVAEQGALDSLEVDVRSRVHLLQLLEAPLGQNRRLVRLNDRVEKALELLASGSPQLLQLGDVLLVLRGSVGEEIVGALALEREIRALEEEGEAMTDDVEVPGIQLLLLDEDLLANADLAEVVQQPRVPELA